MRINSLGLLLLLASFLVLANSSSEPILGGWNPIKDMKDPHVAEIGEFAVSEHNKLANSKLALRRVIKGETQVVAGTNYKLIIEVKVGNHKVKRYEAVVYERVWENFRKLISFKPLKI